MTLFAKLINYKIELYFPCPFGCGSYITQCSSEGFVALFLSTKISFTSSTISFLAKTLTAEESTKQPKLWESSNVTHRYTWLRRQYANLSYRNRIGTVLFIGDGVSTVGGGVSMAGFKSGGVAINALGVFKMAAWFKFGVTLKAFRGVEKAFTVVESPVLAWFKFSACTTKAKKAADSFCNLLRWWWLD